MHQEWVTEFLWDGSSMNWAFFCDHALFWTCFNFPKRPVRDLTKGCMPVFTEKTWSSLIFHRVRPELVRALLADLTKGTTLKKSFFGFYQLLLSFKKSKQFENLGTFLRIGPKHPKTIAMESLISGPGYISQWNKTSLSNLYSKPWVV